MNSELKDNYKLISQMNCSDESSSRFSVFLHWKQAEVCSTDEGSDWSTEYQLQANDDFTQDTSLTYKAGLYIYLYLVCR